MAGSGFRRHRSAQGAPLSGLVAFLACIAWALSGPVRALAAAPLPIARGELTYNAVQSRFDGVMEWEIPASGGPLLLVLYPNRYLASSEPDERETLEAYGAGVSEFDRFNLRRHGALLVVKTTERIYPGACAAALGHGVAPTSESALPRTFNGKETVLSVAPSALLVAPSGCRSVRVEFAVHPPFSEGNFGMVSTSLMRFAGPLFPFARGTLYDLRVLFRGLPLECKECARLEDGTVELHTSRFPSPLLFESPARPVRVTYVSGLRLEFVGSPNAKVEDRLVELVSRMVRESDLLRALTGPLEPASLRVHVDVLVQNLAMRQPGEVQLGRGFLKVSPLFEKYHEAAFLRAAFQELLVQALARARPPRTTDDLRALTSLARLVTEERVGRWFRSLDEIRSVSESLRFIPFFNDILSGRALVNNEVFLGGEEKPGPVDTAPMDAVFPLFTGGELRARLEWCHDPGLVNGFFLESSLLAERQMDPGAFVDRWRATAGGRCAVAFGRYLETRTQTERIRVGSKSDLAGRGRIVFSRADAPRRPQDLFRATGDAPPRDTVRFVVERADGGEGAPAKVTTTSTTGNDVRALPAGEDDDEAVRARIDGPNTDLDADRQVLPRRVDFLLTGIKVRFDSRVGSIEGQQGVQWRMRGDNHARAFTLLMKKEGTTYYFEPNVSASVGGEEEPTGEVRVEDDAILRLPRQFPVGLGVSTEVARETEVWGVASVGARAVSSSVLVPTGFETKLSVAQSIVRRDEAPQGLKAELLGKFYLPLARLTTGVSSLRIGQATEPEELGGPANVPGMAADSLVAKRYFVMRNEVRYVLAYGLKWNVLSTVLFEDLILYGAHNAAFDSSRFRLANPSFDSIQSAQFGLQFYGAFFGAKNQSVSADVARGLGKNPRNVFSVTVGRNF